MKPVPDKPIDDIAESWSKRAQTGEWKKNLTDPDSYANIDESYKRFRLIVERISSFIKPNRVLDLGCGTCDLWDVVSRFCPEEELYGVDIAEDMLAEAKQKYPKSNFFKRDIFDVADFLPDLLFDIVLSRGVIINHVGLQYFKGILNNIQPFTGKVLIFDYINREWFKEGKEAPNKPLFTSKEIKDMIGKTRFKDWYIYIIDEDRRDPIVIVSKDRLEIPKI